MKPVTQIQRIKKDLSERRYILKKVKEQRKNLFHKKKIKKLMKKVKEAKKESLKERMLLLFELEKEMREDRTKEKSKYDKTLARKIYKSFVIIYPWML